MDIHDVIAAELCRNKSISALIWLINQGRELEFKVGTSECFVSRHGSAKTVSLYQGEQEQCFDSIEDLVSHSKIGDQDFMEAWNFAVIVTLF